MSETPKQRIEEESALSSSDDDPESRFTGQSSLDGSRSHPRSHPSLSSWLPKINSSTASVQSNLFTHSWREPALYSILSLCRYIASTPATPISLLQWCKDRKGVKHEFLLLKVERLGSHDLWLRLDRRMHENARAANAIISPVPSGDSVKLCNDLSGLFDASQSKVQVETKFTVPPLVQKLGNLLSILMEGSPDYKLYSENCYFFCAVIYECLVSIGKGVNVHGTPSTLSILLAPEAKAQIKKRMGIWPSEASSSLELGLGNPPDVRAVPPDFSPGRMCVAVDLGTVSSGVACGISSSTVEQILWPGPNRKVPTCLVYDAEGRVAAWGHRAQTVNLERGWIRCEMFKLYLDSTSASKGTPQILPRGKEPIDVITDYLRKLWVNAKPKIIKCGYTQDTLKSADIWISIPSTWTLRSGEMMRNAAYAAGLVAPQGSEQDEDGRDRLHIISEMEAAAVHCALWRDLHLKPNQSFMVCRAGGDTTDIAIYKVLGNVTQIAERYSSSGASCGSHFLDICFRNYLEQWHRTRNIRLSETNLTHFMHAFTYSHKLSFTGGQDATDLHFECYDVSDYADVDLSDDEFFNGQLVVPAKVLREQVFDPIVNNVLDLLAAQLRKVDSVDALLLVGGFSANQYLFDRIWNTFHVRFKDRIQNPKDPDIATSLGAAQCGLAQGLIQRPTGLSATTAPESRVGTGANQAAKPEGTRNSRVAAMMLGLIQVLKQRIWPALNPGQRKICVAVDFGTVLSGAACGVSSSTIEQILWPGSYRKAPTCLVYDAKGRIVAWGHKAQIVKLEKGWIRCEMFKLYLDATGAFHGIPQTLPSGKEPIDIITDYLRILWENAKPNIIKHGYTQDALKSADIWISIPVTWSVRSGEMLRKAAYAAGLVAPRGSRQHAGGRDRLHIISESEAAAVHCAVQRDLRLQPNQSFMVCDAGGCTIDVTAYRILNDIEALGIAKRCTCLGASCGSYFLDLRFRAYLEQWHRRWDIPLRAENLHRFLLSFREADKLIFDGTQQLLFDCYNSYDYDNRHLPPTEYSGGQFVVEAKVLCKEVFDPVVSEVIDVLERQLYRVGTVDALMLVGGFSGNPYLFRRIHARFGSRIQHIVRPLDGDIASSLGAAQCGVAQNFTQRPLMTDVIIVPKSYIVGVGLPFIPEPREGVANRNSREVQDSSALYIMVKDTVWKRRQPLTETMTKISSNPSDSVFVARFYCSDSDELQSSTNSLDHLRDWSIDLGSLPLIRDHLNASPLGGCRIVFELGVEVDGADVYAMWRYNEVEGGRIFLDYLY